MTSTSASESSTSTSSPSKTVLIPLPRIDFDPTEAAVSWRVLKSAGIQIMFATPDGKPAEADRKMLTGEGLDAVSFLPLMGSILRATSGARQDYAMMVQSAEFQNPMKWSEIGDCKRFDGLLLPGGHCARGMREFLESKVLQEVVVGFFENDKPVAAVCHGVLLAARSLSSRTGKSVLFGRKTTALTWKLESTAWSLTRYTTSDPNYYRTYVEADDQPVGFMSVEQEVKRNLAADSDFCDAESFKASSGLFRDSDNDDSASFVCIDRNYVSARWPGDVHKFANVFAKLVKGETTTNANADFASARE